MFEGVLVQSLIRMTLSGFLVVLGGSWRFLGDSWQCFFADSAMCVALWENTTIECKKQCQKSLKTIHNWT